MRSSATDRILMMWIMSGLLTPSRFIQCMCLLRALICLSLGAYNVCVIRHNTFASAGSDGTVSIWDHKVKKRLRQYPKYASSIPSIAFNCDGTRLAVGVSYTWDEGDEGLKKEGGTVRAVWVRKVGDEVKVRD
jgi:WD40 repeat protein